MNIYKIKFVYKDGKVDDDNIVSYEKQSLNEVEDYMLEHLKFTGCFISSDSIQYIDISADIPQRFKTINKLKNQLLSLLRQDNIDKLFLDF